MQQSLSSEDATLENSLLRDKSGFGDQIAPEKSIVNITNKSVIFSDRTEIQVAVDQEHLIIIASILPCRNHLRHERPSLELKRGKPRFRKSC